MQRDYGRKRYKSEQQKSKNNSNNLIILVTIVALFLILMVNFSGYHDTQIFVTEYGSIQEDLSTEGLVIREEKVITADQAGEIEFNYQHGQRVASGNQVATVFNQQSERRVYNYQAGLISYAFDGLEDRFSFEQLSDLNYEAIANIEVKPNLIESGTKVEEGSPLLKIVDNAKFYLAVFLPQDKLLRYERGARVQIDILELAGEKFQGEITQIIMDQPDNIMLIESKRFIPEIIDLRRVNVDLLRREYKGLVVPDTVINNQEDQPRVKVNGHISDYYREVEILGRVDDQVVIRGVGPGVRLIKDN